MDPSTYEVWDVDVSNRQGWGACLCYSAIRLRNYHPMLEWFVVVASHLRDAKDAPKANKQQSSATHELIIAAIDPEPWLLKEYDPLVEAPPKLLLPLEIVHQFSNLNDAQMMMIMREVVDTLLSRDLNPDREQFHDWLRWFNKLAATV